MLRSVPQSIVLALVVAAASACGGTTGPLEQAKPGIAPEHGAPIDADSNDGTSQMRAWPEAREGILSPVERVRRTADAGVEVDAGFFADAGADADADAGALVDAGIDVDAGPFVDAGVDVDAGAFTDAGVDLDAGSFTDAGVDVDAGEDTDAGVDVDGGEFTDAGADVDAGAFTDAGVQVDAGWFSDAGAEQDAGTAIDAGTTLPSPPQRTISWAASRHQVPSSPPARGSYRIHLIDVGTGLALLVQGHDFTMLFDGGSSDDLTGISNGASSNRLLAYLFAALGPSGPSECAPRGDASDNPWVGGAELEIDYVFLSHAHQDHVSLLKDVLHCYRVKNVIEPGAAYGTQVYGDFVQKVASESGTHYRTATPVPSTRTATLGTRTIPFGPDVSWTQFLEGDATTLGTGARFRILHANATPSSNVNDTSLVVRIDLGRTSLLLTGDAESGARADPSAPAGGVEAHLLAHWAHELDADLMQVAHHGSKTSSRLGFLQAVSPELALLSSGPRKYGTVVLPDPEVVSAYQSVGATLLRTDLNDGQCPESDRIGVDDAKSGGCDNWVIDVGP